jgi:phage head maturation protease
MPDLVYIGDEVKSTPDGRVRGYLLRFDGASGAHDVTGDFFTPETDFGRPIDKLNGMAINLYYHHGFDESIGKKDIGYGTINVDDKGMWLDAQLKMSEEYAEKIAQLVKMGKLAYSSGAASHLVERKQMPDGRYMVTRWPIGEASLTPTPAEPRNFVKSMMEPEKKDDGMEMDDESMDVPDLTVGTDVAEYVSEVFAGTSQDMVTQALHSLWCVLCGGMHEVYESGMPAKDYVPALVDEFARKAKDLVMAVDTLSEDELKSLQSIGRKANRPTSVRDVEGRLRDALRLSREEAKRLSPTVWESMRDASTDDAIKSTPASEVVTTDAPTATPAFDRLAIMRELFGRD